MSIITEIRNLYMRDGKELSFDEAQELKDIVEDLIDNINCYELLTAPADEIAASCKRLNCTIDQWDDLIQELVELHKERNQ